MEKITYEVVERRVVNAGELDINKAFYDNPKAVDVKPWGTRGLSIPFGEGILVYIPSPKGWVLP